MKGGGGEVGCSLKLELPTGQTPVAANRPRPALRKRASFPFALISRIIAAYTDAAGVLPDLDFQSPWASAASTICLADMGVADSARTIAAA